VRRFPRVTRSSLIERHWVSLGDQIVSSATNFALTVFAARLLGPEGLGIVTVGLAIGYAGIALERALVGEPLLVLGRANGTEGALGTATVTGVALGLVAVGAGALRGGELGLVIAVVGIFGPTLLLQDAGRYEAIALRRPERALASDVLWLGIQTILLFVLLVWKLNSPTLVVVGWGLGAAAGLGVLLPSQLGRVTPLRAGTWLRRSARLSGWMSAQTVISQAGAQLTLIAIGGVTGLAGLGILRSVIAITGPLSVVLLGLGLLALPELVDAKATGGLHVLKVQVARWLAVSGLISITYAGLIVVLREPLLRGLFGREFESAVPLAVPISLSIVALGFGAASGWGARAISAGWVVLATQIIASAVGIPMTVLLAASSGPEGAAWGIAIQSVVLCGASWSTFRFALGKVQRDEEH
jgi:O-antigen/teichoic acid export membrane protein